MITSFPLRSCIFLTRKCYMRCDYCRIRESPLESRELNAKEWVEAFKRLDELGSDFNLILGNETLALEQSLVAIINSLKNPYALYTSAPIGLWHRWKQPLVEAGLRSLACGFDYPIPTLDVDNDMYRKSESAWEALLWARDNKVDDLQGTMTISAINYQFMPNLIRQLSAVGIWTGLNVIHYDKDGGFDFFPPRSEIENLLDWNWPTVESTFAKAIDIIKSGALCQIDPDYLVNFPKFGFDLSWHCDIPIISVDPNGRLRCCGYRRGKETRAFSIFDLPQKWDQFFNVWRKEMQECPGCYWSYPWLNEYWINRDPEFGKVVLQDHATQYKQ